jgi:hypothetical protein
MAEEDRNPFEGVPVIYQYTRKQAIEDGVLVDLSEWAAEDGFVIPVACTTVVWHDWIVPPQGVQGLGQSERGRVHDVLWMLLCAIRRGDRSTDQLLFKVSFQQAADKLVTTELKAICGPGDNGEPVMTLMLPTED